MHKRRSRGKRNVGFTCKNGYDENGNIDLNLTYTKDNAHHYLCSIQLQFDTGCAVIHEVSEHFFEEDRQKYFRKLADTLNLDDFSLCYCLK